MTAEHTPLLSVEGLTKVFATRQHGSWFRTKRGVLSAVTDVSFTLDRGEVLGIVGESGCGKTTLARMILRLIEPSSGKVLLRGRDLMSLTRSEVRAYLRPAIRMVFQDPDAALNPAYTIGAGLARAIQMHSSDRKQDVTTMVAALLRRLGMGEEFAAKYPDELSGGEKRRVGICRALSTDPEIIVADEPLSGLDVVLQERVLQLLKTEQEARRFALILVSHDLDRVNQFCDSVLVMHGGRVVEQTVLRRNAEPIREQYRHPYSKMLQQARVDVIGTSARAGSANETADSVLNATSTSRSTTGCTFSPSCPRRRSLGNPPVCQETTPALVPLSDGQAVACHFPAESSVNVAADQSARDAMMIPIS